MSKYLTRFELLELLRSHEKWLGGGNKGNRANLTGANLTGASLTGASLARASLGGANLTGASLARANLTGASLARASLGGANLTGASLTGASLDGANLTGASLARASLDGANLTGANLTGANLTGASLDGANLTGANLTGANLTGASLDGASLGGASGLIKLIGVEPGNFYWKRFEEGLENNGFQFHVGLNCLRDGETFANDERILCSYPGLHFASRSWCAVNYPTRPLEAKIRIPENAQINEPWATDGKASVSAIEVVQVFDVKTGVDVTKDYMPPVKALKKRGGNERGHRSEAR